MSDIHQVYFTDEAAEELGELPSDRRALVMEKVRLMKAIGWQESLRNLAKVVEPDIQQ